MAFTEFPLQNGTTLKNRIVKAALEEMLADVPHRNRPSEVMINLYRAWGQGGAGLILSGHVMIDPLALGAPANPWLAEGIDADDEAAWREYIAAAKSGGSQFWLQINHPGRQQRTTGKLPAYAPSEVPLKLGALSIMFPKPKAMTEADIQKVIAQFVWTAKKAEELGADGVEIHAAHGYLICQFSSPLSNKRTDQWGGSVENRARFLLTVVRAVRAAVSPKFGVGVKINSSDFQRGGFDDNDLHYFVKQLNGCQLDFLEISGGSYENAVMITGHPPEDAGTEAKKASTIAREAYFFVAAQHLLDTAEMPIMVTGGIRTRQTLDDVLGSSPRFLAGVGTAMGLMPDLPNQWKEGRDPCPAVARSVVLPQTLKGAAKASCVRWNMHATGAGSTVWNAVWPTLAFLSDEIRGIKATIQYSNWVKHVPKQDASL